MTQIAGREPTAGAARDRPTVTRRRPSDSEGISPDSAGTRRQPSGRREVAMVEWISVGSFAHTEPSGLV